MSGIDIALKAHGTRARYVQKCRCDECRAANTAYYHVRKAQLARGETNPIVSARSAQAHLQALSETGVGRRTVADLTGCAHSILAGIRSGARVNCRKLTRDAILGVPAGVWSDKQLIDATPTWVFLNELLELGWTRTSLAKLLGSKAKVPALQINGALVTARNAARVERLYHKLSATKRFARAKLRQREEVP